jgi:hypothetical protein
MNLILQRLKSKTYQLAILTALGNMPDLIAKIQAQAQPQVEQKE